MNLLHTAWMPVRDREGQRHWIRPDQLADAAWRAFDADRPDFNGALAQFAIGLLQTTTPVDNPVAWRRLSTAPPQACELQQWFAPVAHAFDLDGDATRFMQDIDLGSDGVAVNDIDALLIESPGEQALKNNTDHFVKRTQVRAMCPACAALALFTLQLNAPAGGAGHRTGLRGGGPLTTLVLGADDAGLWQQLWLNVRPQPDFRSNGGDPAQDAPQRPFPWLGHLGALQVPTPSGALAQSQTHPAHVFWAMPRRIRLDIGDRAGGTCDLCTRTAEVLIRRYATKNYGLNYKGAWNHPLSPYYETKEGWLPLHPQPDGLGYRHWLAWVLGVSSERRTTRAAAVVQRALELDRRTLGGPLRLWAFGYDMDNMKARCWYESTLPIYDLAGCSTDARQGVQAEVARWLAGADLASRYLRDAVKDAWFGAEARGDFSHIDAAFWSSTERAFYAELRDLIAATRDGVERPALASREVWHSALVRTASRLFDVHFVGSGLVDRQNPRRVSQAQRQLRQHLRGSKLRQALGLPVDAPVDRPARKSTARALKEPA